MLDHLILGNFCHLAGGGQFSVFSLDALAKQRFLSAASTRSSSGLGGGFELCLQFLGEFTEFRGM